MTIGQLKNCRNWLWGFVAKEKKTSQASFLLDHWGGNFRNGERGLLLHVQCGFWFICPCFSLFPLCACLSLGTCKSAPPELGFRLQSCPPKDSFSPEILRCPKVSPRDHLQRGLGKIPWVDAGGFQVYPRYLYIRFRHFRWPLVIFWGFILPLGL